MSVCGLTVDWKEKTPQFYGILSISGLRQGRRLDNVKFSTKYMRHV
jgi:hypothetical protein